jgi:hypothetical protein
MCGAPSSLLDAHNLLNHGVRSAELHRLMRNLLGMVPVETTPQRGCDGHDGNRSQNTLQTLHGLLSFVITAIAVIKVSCVGARISRNVCISATTLSEDGAKMSLFTKEDTT